MFSKNNMIFVMFILILFTLSAVSAADNTSTDVVGLQEVDNEPMSVDKTQVLADDDENEVIPNGTFNNLRDDIDDDDDIDFERKNNLW